MRPIRALLVSSLLLATIVSVPAQARVATPIELTATTIVTAERSGYVDVVVPVDARVSPAVERNPDVDISGKGRFVGFWLERSAANGASFAGLSSTRLPAFLGGAQRTYGSYSPALACKGIPDAYPITYDCTKQPPPQAIVLREGRYRLTVLADTSPLRITLTLHGLDPRTTTITPRHALASTQQPLPARDGIGDRLVTFGATAPIQGKVMAWVAAAAKGSGSPVLAERSVCVRADQGAPPPLAFGPHCPNGIGGGYSYQVNLAGQTYGGMGGFVTASSEPNTSDVGVGGSFGDSGGVTLGQTLGVWLQVP